MSNIQVKSANLGFSRMGVDRQLKHQVESFWAGNIDETTLTQGCRSLVASHWEIQKSHEIDIIPSNDFSLYDHVLDHCLLFNVIPSRYQNIHQHYQTKIASLDKNQIPFDYETYFAMARGAQKQQQDTTIDVSALQMKKWFDTNYHFSVPEFEPQQKFSLPAYIKPVHDFLHAKQLGLHTRPVIIGPVSFLLLGKWSRENYNQSECQHHDNHQYDLSLLSLLPSLLPVYVELFQKLASIGVTHVQIDEPILITDEAELEQVRAAYRQVYQILNHKHTGIHVTVATYFGSIATNVLTEILNLPINGLHVDLVRGKPNYLTTVIDILRSRSISSTTPFELSLGVVDGRNVWLANLSQLHTEISTVIPTLATSGIQLIVAPSCSLLHVPFTKQGETKIDPQIYTWLSFGLEKLTEIRALCILLSCSSPSVISLLLSSNQAAITSRATSPLIHRPETQQQMKSLHEDTTRSYYQRKSKFPERYQQQQQRFKLAKLPTTTIGSFPQTAEVRRARAQYRRGALSESEYTSLIHTWTKECLTLQETLDIDVLVHGEFERTDMVEFFANYLTGYIMTLNGWVQSYGSRCVKPPIVYGDVSRISPMTVELAKFSQSCSSRPVKGMLTGPVTCLQWSFVRNDIPRKHTCQQLALAIRQEVQDLESAGIGMIQIDEPALREGLPINHIDRLEYIQWSVDCFLISSCGVQDITQIHTHMCYSDFTRIMNEIIRLDADVITIEHSRSDDTSLLESFATHVDSHGVKGYPNGIGPGVFDIHTPRIPSVEEMVSRIQRYIQYIPIERVWVNPDCGLKTRQPQQVKQALYNMVQATKQVRDIIDKQ